jgi:hypothetical protein
VSWFAPADLESLLSSDIGAFMNAMFTWMSIG